MKYKYIKYNNIENFINECYNKNILNEIIDEENHMFNTQYKLSNEISNVVYEMILKNVKNNIYPTSNNEHIDVVSIKIEDGINPYTNVVADIYRVDNEKKRISISLILPPNILTINKQMALNKISNAIVHELMHGNIFINRLNNGQEINDMPSFYAYIIKIMKTINDEENIAYKFAYAIYATYYQEMQAIISQTAHNIFNIIKQNNIKEYNNDILKKYLRFCEPYQIYGTILNETLPIINSMDDYDIHKYIINIFSENGFDCTISFIREQSKIIEEKSKKALRKIINNATLIFKEELY